MSHSSLTSLKLVLGLLEVCQHGVGITHLERIRSRVLHNWLFDKELLNHTVLDDHAVSPAAFTETTLSVPEAAHAHSSGKGDSSVREKLDLLESPTSRSLVLLESLVKTPLTHDKGVIDTQAEDFVNSERLELGVVLFVAWQVRRRAGRRKGSWQGKDDDTLSSENLLGAADLPVKRILVGGIDALTGDKGYIGDLLAFLLGSGPFRLECVR